MQKFQNNIQDQFGNEITLPTIEVRNVVGGGLSSLFSDNGSTPLANPFIAQDISEFFFYAANARYDIFVTGPVTDSSLDILLFDPADGAVDASTARTGNFLFDADVTGIDPEAASIKFNDATPANITSCRIALTSLDAVDIADLTALSLVGSRMRVWDELDPTQLQEFVVSTVPALDVDHFEFTVDFIAGSAAMPADDLRLRVQFELTSFLGAGITSGNQNSTLFWDTSKQWIGTDAVQVNPATPEVGGRIRSPDSAVADVSRAMVYHDVGNSIGGTLYAETETDEGFYLFSDFNGAPRTWEFGYDDGSFNGILAFHDSPLGLVVFAAARYLQGEKSAADADVAGFGQWWVRDDAPNTPMFTRDDGTDVELDLVGGGGLGRGAKVFNSSNHDPANVVGTNWDTASGEGAVPFTSEVFDTDTIHDNSTNNTRLTTPAGINRVRLTAGYTESNMDIGVMHMRFRLNGVENTLDASMPNYSPMASLGSVGSTGAPIDDGNAGMTHDSGIIDVATPGTDYYELMSGSQANPALWRGGKYWFQMEIID